MTFSPTAFERINANRKCRRLIINAWPIVRKIYLEKQNLGCNTTPEKRTHTKRTATAY